MFDSYTCNLPEYLIADIQDDADLARELGEYGE